MDDDGYLDATWKVIVPLSVVPDNGVVTKRTGAKEYTVRRQLRIFYNASYKKDGDKVVKEIDTTIFPRQIDSGDGCVFLADQDGNMTVYPDTTEVVWHVSGWQLMEVLNPPEDK